MRLRSRGGCLTAALLLLVGAMSGSAAAALPAIFLDPVVTTGLASPVDLAHAGDGSGRLFIVEKGGRIKIWDGSQLLPTSFLDLSGLVSTNSERGLLGLAFHPDYESNGFFYVNYTDTAGDTVIARYSVSGDPDVADAASGQVLLTYDQPAANHNGGDLAFGPDGHLYISSGDGGGVAARENAQDPGSLLGKILRIAADGSVPADNPFVGVVGAAGEVWALGLRNPWRISFDRLTGDLFIGDVGQGSWEEIDFQPAASDGGENYGWRCYEGNHAFDLSGCGPAGSYDFPVIEYPSQEPEPDCSVTGGFRYRGEDSALYGAYLYGDFCSGRIWGALPGGAGQPWTSEELLDTSLLISSFGEDEAGEVYAVDLGGVVYRVAGLIFTDGFESGDTSAWSSQVP